MHQSPVDFFVPHLGSHGFSAAFPATAQFVQISKCMYRSAPRHHAHPCLLPQRLPPVIPLPFDPTNHHWLLTPHCPFFPSHQAASHLGFMYPLQQGGAGPRRIAPAASNQKQPTWQPTLLQSTSVPCSSNSNNNSRSPAASVSAVLLPGGQEGAPWFEAPASMLCSPVDESSLRMYLLGGVWDYG